MLTLGIETSCDETSCAVLKGRDTILSNVISSSLFRHQPFGGVVPEIASRHCLEQIDIVFRESLCEAKIEAADLDLIAVTKGPGLIGSLFVGVSFAKALSFRLGIPLVGVNHLEAHLVANFIGKKEPEQFIGLLVSGGHTSLSYHKKGKVKMLGSTVDDAVGEAFDKVAKILGLGYPGGPVIDQLAREGNPEAFKFTKPKLDNEFDFSFSGIKTAVLYAVQKTWHPKPFDRHPKALRAEGSQRSFARPIKPGKLRMTVNKLTTSFIRDMAASFQKAVVDWLIGKALAAQERYGVKDIVVGGGVSANSRLRQKLSEEASPRGVNAWFPEKILALDNAAMIARRGFELHQKGRRDSLALVGSAHLPMG